MGGAREEFDESLSARRAWIEMPYQWGVWTTAHVALRKESVDRNMGASYGRTAKIVVALRKESVDRNQYLSGVLDFAPGSLSARRAWIEIDHHKRCLRDDCVALRKESVDRNIIDWAKMI